MPQRSCRAVFMRGGTSKAIMFRASDLPADRADWAPIFLAAIGSPDPNGRQLDGMGGGVSSLSKVCVIGPPSRDDADVDYTFAQIGIGVADVDYAGNCGNMSSAIGPFAVDEGLVPPPADGEAVVRIHNTNTSKIIIARFPVKDGVAEVDGDLALDGVAGTAAPVRLDFSDPGGAKTGRLLPTGHASDIIELPGFGPVRVSLVDAANPTVLVAASDIGADIEALPAALERDTALLERLETLRRLGAVAMGLSADVSQAARVTSIPKLAMLAAPRTSPTLSGRVLAAEDMDILARMISVGQPHRAVPLTAALCLAVACRIPGSVAHGLMRPGNSTTDPTTDPTADPTAAVRIAHPSGVMLVAADVRIVDGRATAPSATIFRTARRLFAGEVFYRAGQTVLA